MTILAWLIGGLFFGYGTGRLVAAYKYGGWIDRVSRRNADLEHRLENMLDFENEIDIEIARYEHRDRITQ